MKLLQDLRPGGLQTRLPRPPRVCASPGVGGERPRPRTGSPTDVRGARTPALIPLKCTTLNTSVSVFWCSFPFLVLKQSMLSQSSAQPALSRTEVPDKYECRRTQAYSLRLRRATACCSVAGLQLGGKLPI